MSSAASITVRVLRPVEGGGAQTAGAGWLCAHNLVVTCAHVVNAALGRPRESEAQPDSSALVWVRAPVLGDGSAAIEKKWRVVAWTPPAKSDLGGFEGDVAFLVPADEGFERPLARLGIGPAAGAAYDAFGFPPNIATGRSSTGAIGSPAGARFELKPANADASSLAPGFSGAPVMVDSDVVGIVSSVSNQTNLGYLTPIGAFPSGHLRLRMLPGVASRFSHIRDLLFRLEELDQREQESDNLDLRGVFCKDYAEIETLLRKPPPDMYDDECRTPKFFLDRANAELDATLLSAPGGSGKTHFLIDIADEAMAIGRAVYWLDLSTLDKAEKSSTAPTREELFRRTSLAGGYRDFEAARLRGEKLLIIADGLNERSSFRDEVAAMLAEIRKLDSVPVILGDRLSHRTSRANFQSATLSPLSVKEIRDRVGESLEDELNWKRLLSSPFFLSLYLKVRGADRTNSPTRRDMFHRYFADHVFQDVEKWTPEDIAAPAYRFYRNVQGRAAPRVAWLKQGFTEADMDRLQNARAVTSPSAPDSDIEFVHQLLHDWCAANHVASLPREEWTNDKFKWLTLRHGSADAVGLAAELVKPAQLNDFLICAYDWSWVAVLEVILDFEQHQHGGPSPVQVDFRDAIFALNALRQFDLFEHTREAARGPLHYYSALTGALPVSELADADKVFAVYKKHYGTAPLVGALSEFRTLFLEGVKGKSGAVKLLSKGPLLGWTAANMIRHGEIDDNYVTLATFTYDILRAAAIGAQEAIGVRWRIAHTLGRAAQHARVEPFLLKILFDAEENDQVRFGAARSLMESAALTKDPTQRTRILATLAKRVGEIQSITARSELCKATVIAEDDAAPIGWYDMVEKLLNAGLAAAKAAKSPDVGSWEDRLARVKGKKAALKPGSKR